MSKKAAFVESEKGRILVRDAEIAQPGEGEVLIKVHACAIQSADAKVAKLAMIPLEYPAILGSPIAGVVEALGPGVSKFTVGERVVCGTKVFVHKKVKYGELQRFSIVDESKIIESCNTHILHPARCSLRFLNTNLHRPTIPASPLPESEQGKKVLVWGGSSDMGALSISCLKVAGYTVISTSSPHNFDILRSCGADYISDHSDPATVSAIRDLFPIDYWFDTISLKSSLSTIFKILAPNNEPATKANILTLLPLVMAGLKNSDIPAGITTQFHRFSTHASENADWQRHFLSRGGFLEQGIKSGILKAVPADVVGGLDSVAEGVEKVNDGVSGRKIVVEPWN